MRSGGRLRRERGASGGNGRRKEDGGLEGELGLHVKELEYMSQRKRKVLLRCSSNIR
jgi:hypothetical protein